MLYEVITGKKLYIDHKILSIQQFIKKTILDMYNCVDINIHQENLFHTKMLLRDFDLRNYLFATAYEGFSEEERQRVKDVITSYSIHYTKLYEFSCDGN